MYQNAVFCICNFKIFPRKTPPDPRCGRGDPLTHPPSARRGPAPPLLWPTRHTSPRGLYPPCLLSFWDLPPPLQACLTYTEKAGGFNYPKKPSLHEIITENWLEKNYSFREKKTQAYRGSCLETLHGCTDTGKEKHRPTFTISIIFSVTVVCGMWMSSAT